MSDRCLRCPKCGRNDFGWRTLSGGFSCGRCGYEISARELLEEYIITNSRIAELEAALKPFADAYLDITDASGLQIAPLDRNIKWNKVAAEAMKEQK